MSIEIMTAVWNRKLNITNKIVFLKLADNSSDEGVCWPSVPHIAAKCGMTVRSVQRALSFLEKNRCLTRQIRAGKSTYFTINDPSVWLLPPPQSHHVRKSPTPATESPLPPPQSHPEPSTRNPQETKTVIVSVNHGDKLRSKPIDHILSDEDLERVRQFAPGWDKYELFRLYDAWCEGKEPPKNRKAAFFGWLKKFTKCKPPNSGLFDSKKDDQYG